MYALNAAEQQAQIDAQADAPTPETTGDMAHGPIMAILRVANKYGIDYLAEVAADTEQARASGLTVVYGSGNNSANRIVVPVPTDVPAADALAIVDRIRKLAALAGRIAAGRIDAGEEALDALTDAAHVELAKLRTLDATLWQAFCEPGKQWLTGEEAAHADYSGSHWTKSNKGNATTIRYDESAQARQKDNKSDHAYLTSHGSVSARDLSARDWD